MNKQNDKLLTAEQNLTTLIDLHYGEDRAGVRANIRTIAKEYSAQQVAIAVAEKDTRIEDLEKIIEIQKNKLLFYATTELPARDAEIDELKHKLNGGGRCSCCKCPDCSGTSLIG